ncbi:hypothetical protein CBL_07966 [Carabus blaptoides fortunei]
MLQMQRRQYIPCSNVTPTVIACICEANANEHEDQTVTTNHIQFRSQLRYPVIVYEVPETLAANQTIGGTDREVHYLEKTILSYGASMFIQWSRSSGTYDGRASISYPAYIVLHVSLKLKGKQRGETDSQSVIGSATWRGW